MFVIVTIPKTKKDFLILVVPKDIKLNFRFMIMTECELPQQGQILKEEIQNSSFGFSDFQNQDLKFENFWKYSNKGPCYCWPG